MRKRKKRDRRAVEFQNTRLVGDRARFPGTILTLSPIRTSLSAQDFLVAIRLRETPVPIPNTMVKT